jgi:hypothetical protein
MHFCPDCQHIEEESLDDTCGACGARIVDTLAPEPQAPAWIESVYKARVLSAMLCGLLAALSYGSIVKNGPALPGLLTAGFSLLAVLLMPAR